MGLNATIDHPECYQLGDLSSKIVTFFLRFIPIYLNYVNMCKEQKSHSEWIICYELKSERISCLVNLHFGVN